MSDKNDKSGIDPIGRKFLKLWVIGIIILFIGVGSYMIIAGYENKQTAVHRHIERMTPNMTEPGLTAENFLLPANATPTNVTSGIYIDRIKEMSFSESYWTPEFWIWFKWNGSSVKPGEDFQVIDADIISKELVDEYTNGTEHYQIYLVTAKITKYFDETRFPIDSHVLNVEIEDKKSQRENLIYIPDNSSPEINSNVYVPGYEVADSISIIEKPRIYESNFGDPRISKTNTTYSKLRAGIDIYRGDLGFYIRIFVGLFIAVAAALVALFIKPTFAEPRFGLGAGALFVAIANTIVTSGLIPKTGTITIADMVNDLGLLLILVTIMQSTISLYIYDKRGEKRLSKKFDLYSFITLLILYIVINALIVAFAW